MDDLFQTSSEPVAKNDLFQLLTVFLRKWKLFLCSIIICIIFAFLYIRYLSTPVYKINSSILIKDEAAIPTLNSVAAFNGYIPTQSMSKIANVTSLLQSKALMKRVITDLGLTTTYHFTDGVKETETYGKNVPIKVIASKIDSTIYDQAFTIEIKSGSIFTLTDYEGETSSFKFGQEIKKPYGTFTIVTTPAFSNIGLTKSIVFYFHDVATLVDNYSKALSITPFSIESSVLIVSFLNPLPKKGIDVINKLLELYAKDSFGIKNRSINNTITFLDERLRYVTTLISGVEQQVEQYKRRNELTDVSTQATEYIAQANANNNSLSEWAIQIDILESLENYLNQAPGQYQLVPSTLGIQDPTLMNLITKFNELQSEKERLLRSIKANNPVVLNINEQLSNLRLNILENLRNIKNSLIIKSNNYKANSERFRSKINRVPVMERDLLEISRQQSIKQNIYAYLLQKREESTIAKAAIVPDSEVIDPPRPESFPVSPNILTILIITLLAGLAIPFGYIYYKEFLNKKIRRKDNITEETSIPILTEIPHSYYEKVIVKPNSQNIIVEQFRHIRAKILFRELDKKNKIYLVTSAKSGEGKSFFSINIASSLHQAGKKVVLLELDFHNSSYSKDLSLVSSVGVTDFLTSDHISIDDILQFTDKIPDLPIIASGSQIKNTSELLILPKFNHLINELKSSFDYIIIDASAIGEISDIFSINFLVDQTILLMRYNYTLKKDIATMNDYFKSNLIINPTIVFNDIELEPNVKNSDKKIKKNSTEKITYS